MVTLNDFQMDKQGARFRDVADHPDFGPALAASMAEMSTGDALGEMERAELEHQRPALAGVIKRIEARPEVSRACLKHIGKSALDRFKMATGVACRLVMEGAGWRKRMTNGKGVKGSIAAPISEYFSVAQRYDPPPAKARR